MTDGSAQNAKPPVYVFDRVIGVVQVAVFSVPLVLLLLVYVASRSGGNIQLGQMTLLAGSLDVAFSEWPTSVMLPAQAVLVLAGMNVLRGRRWAMWVTLPPSLVLLTVAVVERLHVIYWAAPILCGLYCAARIMGRLGPARA